MIYGQGHTSINQNPYLIHQNFRLVYKRSIYNLLLGFEFEKMLPDFQTLEIFQTLQEP